MDVEFKMGFLGINRNRSPSFVSGLLHLDTVHDGHDDNSRGDPSRSWVTKHPILSRRPSLVGYAICSLHIGTRNLTLWLHRKRTNALSQTPDLGVNFDASSTTKITTGNFGWFRTIIDVGDLPAQNWFLETQGDLRSCCVS